MKKWIIILIVLMIIAIVPIVLLLMQYQSEKNEITKFNLEYEQYKDKTTYGTNVASLINYTINNNKNHNIEKDENGKYIDDDKYCVKIEIKMPNSEEEMSTYDMETIASLGVERFVRNFNVLEFKCIDINHNSYGRVSRLVFELSE